MQRPPKIRRICMGKPTHATWSGCCERGKKIKRTGDYEEGKRRKPVFFSSPYPLSAVRFLQQPPSPPPLPPNPASLDLKEVSVQGRELFSDIQVLNLFINLPNNVFPLLIMMLDASKRRINSPRSNWQSVFYLGVTFFILLHYDCLLLIFFLRLSCTGCFKSSFRL